MAIKEVPSLPGSSEADAGKRNINKKSLKRVHWIIGFIIFFATLAAWACSPAVKTITVYKETKIPVLCSPEPPIKPEPTQNPVEMNLLILRYAEELEAALRSCL